MTIPTIFRPWLAPVALLFALALAAGAWNRDHRQLLAAKRTVEADNLRLHDQIVERDATVKDLGVAIDEQRHRYADLDAAYKAAHAAAHGSKDIYSATFATGTLQVKGEPAALVRTSSFAGKKAEVTGQKATAPGGAVGPDREGTTPEPPTEGLSVQQPPDVAQAKCVLSQNDTASISVELIQLQTEAGNIVALGTAAGFRETPLPRTLLFGGPFKATASSVAGLGEPPPKRWGFELGGQLGKDGTGLGVGALFPLFKLPFVNVQVEPRLDAVIGGSWSVQGWLGYRWG